jgi:hypothetical protein
MQLDVGWAKRSVPTILFKFKFFNSVWFYAASPVHFIKSFFNVVLESTVNPVTRFINMPVFYGIIMDIIKASL